MEPMNYSGAFANLQSPDQAFMSGFKDGAAIRASQLQAQQQEVAMAQQKKQMEVIQALISNRNATANDYSNAMLAVPGMHEQLEKAWSTKNTAQQQVAARELAEYAAAIQNQKPEIASAAMRAKADAIENTAGAPTPESQALRAKAELVDKDPEFANYMIKSTLAANPQGKAIVDNLAAIGKEKRDAELHPDLVKKGAAEASEAGSKATTAAVTAKYAEPDALLDLEKKGWDIKALRADIEYKRENNRIAAMNAAISRETNDLKRSELRMKIEEAVRERDEKVKTKIADVESARTNMDNMINTVDRILSNKSLDDVLGSFEGRMPSASSAMDDEESDAISLIDTVKSQAFLAQIPNIKGMGALSNAEGEKLQSALQNLDRAQSEKQFRANLKEAQRLILKARKNVADRYGVPESVPDTPAAAPSADEVDALVRKYTGGQ